MIANANAAPTTQAAHLVTWIAGELLEELIDAWARETHAGGGYDLTAHSLLADMALEGRDLEGAAVAAEMTGEEVAAYGWRRLANDVRLEAAAILIGLRAGRSLDDLAAG